MKISLNGVPATGKTAFMQALERRRGERPWIEREGVYQFLDGLHICVVSYPDQQPVDHAARVFLATSRETLQRLLDDWDMGPDPAPVIVASNKWMGLEDPAIRALADEHMMKCCVVNTLTGEGVIECIELALTLVV
jgi:hypothetical protein